MRRIAHRILLAVCLFLTAVLLAGWLRTHLATDVVCWTGPGGRYYEVATIPGQVRLTVARGWPAEAAEPVRWYRGTGAGPAGRAVFGHNVIRGPWFAPGFAIADRRTRVATRRPAATGSGGAAGTMMMTPTATVLVPYRTYAGALGPMVLLLGAYPWAVAWRAVRDKRIRRELMRQGLCTECGYDLRASAGRCPECGTLAQVPGDGPQIAMAREITT
jgi:hypothetical protein